MTQQKQNALRRRLFYDGAGVRCAWSSDRLVNPLAELVHRARCSETDEWPDPRSFHRQPLPRFVRQGIADN